MTTIPVAQLNLVIGDENNYITQAYYVYPEFVKTIEYMKTMGANLETGFSSENVSKITINDYKNEIDAKYDSSQMQDVPVEKLKDIGYGAVTQQYEFTDKAEIEAICNALVPTRFTYSVNNSVNVAQYLEINIVYTNSESNTNAFSIRLDKLPENIKAKIGY